MRSDRHYKIFSENTWTMLAALAYVTLIITNVELLNSHSICFCYCKMRIYYIRGIFFIHLSMIVMNNLCFQALGLGLGLGLGSTHSFPILSNRRQPLLNTIPSYTPSINLLYSIYQNGKREPSQNLNLAVDQINKKTRELRRQVCFILYCPIFPLILPNLPFNIV